MYLARQRNKADDGDKSLFSFRLTDRAVERLRTAAAGLHIPADVLLNRLIATTDFKKSNEWVVDTRFDDNGVEAQTLAEQLMAEIECLDAKLDRLANLAASTEASNTEAVIGVLSWKQE